MNDHLCTAFIAASGDPGAGTNFHEFSGRNWAFCKRNTRSRNAVIYYRNTKKKTNRDGTILQHYKNKSNWKSRWNNIATLTLKLNSIKIIMNNTKLYEQKFK